ncbi:MAG: YeiH family protein [Gemmatimonadaceae bacterium]
MHGRARGRVLGLLPGFGVASVIALAAWAIAPWLGSRVRLVPDAVVLALLLGLGLRGVWRPSPTVDRGIGVAARVPLELAIVLLGVSTDLRLLAGGGAWLAGSVITVTAVALGAGVLISRGMGLSRTHALLVASGNAICGNSAIAAVATVVRAPVAEVASSIAFTAVLSIGLVLLLPVAGVLLSLTDLQFGALAGMTVYAVPQVLAATYPVSARAGEVGTLVKLIRVLLLVPWLTILAFRERRLGGARVGPRPRLAQGVLPPYVLLFLALAMLRTLGLVPEFVMPPARAGSHALTTLAMAALGLSVEPGAIRTAGWRTAAAATAALLVLCLCALLVIANG